MHAFSVNGIEHLTGVGAKTLHHWDRIGFIQPSIRRGGYGRGKGRERLYSVQDIILLKAARMMRDAGVPFGIVQQVIPRLRSTSDIALLPVKARFLISSTQRMLLLTDEDLFDALQRPEQSMLWYILELGRVIEDIHQAVETYTGRTIIVAGETQKSAETAQSPGPTQQELSAEDYFNRALGAQAYSDEQITYYTEAIRLNPQYGLAYNNRGVAREAQGDLAGAIADYTEAIRLNPQYALAYNNRGLGRWAQGDVDGAIDDYLKAIRLNPQYTLAYYRHSAHLLQLSGKPHSTADLGMS